MAEKRYVLPDTEPVTMTGDAAGRLIAGGNGNAALLYIYILKNRGQLSVSEAAAELKIPEAHVNAAIGTLASFGLLSREAAPLEKPRIPAPADELPQYDVYDIKRELNEGSQFSSLVREVQRSLGKVLSSADLIKLFGIYDHLGLPPEVILMLISHCAGECRRRYGEGRLPTMRFIESVAFSWEREGVVSIETAEEYIKRLENRRSKYTEIKQVLGIRDREFIRSEREYIDKWIDMGHSDDALELAFDRTVLKTGRLTWKYMDTILTDWHSKGMHTADEVSRGERKAPNRPKGNVKPAGAPSGADMARMKKMLDSIKNGQG